MSVNCVRIAVKYVSAVCGQADLHRYTFCFLSFALETYDLRQSSVDHVVIPCIIIIAVIDRIKLCKGERVDSNLITSATEFGHNVAGQELGITSGDIHINIAHAEQAVQHFLKL